MPEDNRRACQELFAVLLGADDPVVGDALQRQVLPVGGALDGRRSRRGRGPLSEEDADTARVVVRQRRVSGEIVLPRRAGVEGLRLELVRADLADPVQPGDADLLKELRELLGEGGRDPVALACGGLVEQAGPDTGELRLLSLVVAAIDPLSLELIEFADERLGGQEDDRLDERDALLDSCLPSGLIQLGLKLLGLLVGEVQRVLDGARRSRVFEQPGRAVVGRGARVGLDLDEEQATGGRDEQVDLADVAGERR